ncbi:IS4 family transposase [Lacrimispora xylanisolvens]|uniref:IS4 family transposase n=1 Tax=Lacrimispora xylanisolvens TaxID=384636 RepID=A0A2S6HCD9_9FIRM|nr:IS1182 family transposase [Hungatella xylanolytica]PPK75149.1 IS4 family transposase [Hungatella xylanolytica]
MLTQNSDKKRDQLQIFCMDDLVPQDHLLRLVDRAIDWSFIYDLVQDKYSIDTGRPSMDPVMLIKIPFIQYLYGIRSMRQTMKEIEVNVAYRWFLGLEMTDKVPHFSTFGKNYARRFRDTNLFEQIFTHILEQCYKFRLVDPGEVFVDATHVKACANNKKMQKRIAKEEALFYEELLKKEINKDRSLHEKRPLKDKDKDDSGDQPPSSGSSSTEQKTIKSSTTDPESGWFRKGEHKHVFAYAVEAACDKNGWILGYTVNPGNLHDSRTFKGLYDKIKEIGIRTLVADAGYKTPAIAKLLIDDGINPLFPYKRPMTKEGFFRKHEFVYDEYYDCYICPNNKTLKYSTTNREGYREYKSCGYICETCPYLKQCTESKEHVKLVTRHIWEPYMEMCEDIRQTQGMKELYGHRKETIERLFGTAKENHGFRYTQLIGKARMEMKVGLTFTCMNLKKLAKMQQRFGLLKVNLTSLASEITKKPYKQRKSVLGLVA